MLVRFSQTSFSAGEISPEMLGRTDTAKHQNGLKKCINAYISPFGGVVRRYGSRFIHQAKYSDRDVVLIKFVYSVDHAYLIEVGDRYLRFYIDNKIVTNDDGSIYELETPYRGSDLRDIKYTQRQEVMFLVHGDYPVYELKRQTGNEWSLNQAAFDPPPFEETTLTPHAYLKFTASNKEVGKTVAVKMYRDDELKIHHFAFTEKDVGARISVNSGVFVIDRVYDPHDVHRDKFGCASGKIVYELASNITAIPDSWTLLHRGWSEELGYPSAAYIHQQRLIFAASKKFPRKIWMSTTGNPYNFDTADSNDDDALSVGIDDNQGNKIIHLAQDQVLLALTAGNEFSVTGGYENGIKPSNVQIRLQSAFGCNHVRPVNIAASMLFVQRAGKQIKTVSNGGYYGTDVEWSTLSEISRHLINSGARDMDYQQDPNSFLWVVCNDGTIALLTYNAEQEIAGWGKVTTQGQFLSVCCIPETHTDITYVAVRRSINGEDKIYIEAFDPDLNTDCAVVCASEKGVDTVGGLDHLNGLRVDIVADGSVMPPQEVFNGKIQIERKANQIEIGLPYTTKADLLFQDIALPDGSIVGARIALSEVSFRFHRTKSAEVYLYGKNSKQLITARKFGGGLLDKSAPFIESDIKIDSIGWDVNEVNVAIEQRYPLPFHLMAVSYVLATG